MQKKTIYLLQTTTVLLLALWGIALWYVCEQTAQAIEEPIVAETVPELTVLTEEPIEVAVATTEDVPVVMETTGRYAQIADEITDRERDLVALTVYHESRGESREGQMAVAEVVFNRLLTRFGGAETIHDVIYADGQFACADVLMTVAIKEPECLTAAYEVVEAVLASTTYIVPEHYMYFSTSQPKTSDFKQIGSHYFR